MGLGSGRSASELFECASKPDAAVTRGMTEEVADRHQLLERDAALVEQLVEYRQVVERREVGREVERQPAGRRDADPVRSDRAVRPGQRRGLSKVDAGLLAEVDAVSDGVVD
jgi:hypothetical protein